MFHTLDLIRDQNAQFIFSSRQVQDFEGCAPPFAFKPPKHRGELSGTIYPTKCRAMPYTV